MNDPRTTTLLALALTGSILATVTGCGSAPQTEHGSAALAGTRPNIIFVFSDDHAPHAISAYGSKINRTPNIDRLAQEGVLFRNTFCGNSICGPSRATILTGKHCHENGFMRNGNRFDGTQTTFPQLLQQAGYQTAVIGKWHLTSDPTGFDYWRVLTGQGQYYNPDFRSPDGRERIEGYATDVTTDLALGWLKEMRDPNQPFMLMCQHKAPHRTWMPGPEEMGLYRDVDIPEPATLFDDYDGRTPATRDQEMTIAEHLYLHYDLKVLPTPKEQESLQGPDRWWEGMRNRMNGAQRAAWDAAFEPENQAFRAANLQGAELVRWKYQRYIKNYLRCVAGVDKSVGQILEYVDSDPELAANTIVIYCSDQGFYLGDHGWYDKRWMYEESMRMPLLARWPGKFRAGSEVEQLVQNIDFAPTFLQLAGAEVPDDVHGASLLPLLQADGADAEWRDAVYYHYYESFAVHEVAAHYGVRTERYKLIRYYEPHRDAWELFDLEVDPDELTSVYDDPSYAAVVAQLKTRLEDLRAKYADTTGELGDGKYDLVAGVARIAETEAGVEFWANATGGYALRSCDRATGPVAVFAQIERGDRGHQRNGYIALCSGSPRRELIRAGFAFGTRKLELRIGNQQVAQADVPDADSHELQVEIDPSRRVVIAQSGDVRIENPLPPSWDGLDAWGFGASNASATFVNPRIAR